MNQPENQSNTNCFTYGNTRIHVIEHFAHDGKPLEHLLTELVIQRARTSERMQ